MRLLMLSKALVHGAYQRKCEEIAALPGIELTVAAPKSWREPRVGEQRLERRYTAGYRLEALPIRANGRHHLHHYPTLDRLVAAVRPDVFHVDEEAFNLATFLAFRAGVRAGARCCFFNWANVDRFYPPPFNLFERYVFRHAAHGIAGNREAAAIVRKHGYTGPLSILPQFGVDPHLFAPREPRAADARFVVGYLGRLVPEKGVLDLLDALSQLPDTIALRIVGDGVLRPQIVSRAAQLGIAARIEFAPMVGSAQMPAELRKLDALALPSRTLPNWKEQFGRILIEAMSCGVPVVGSSSGEIPHVIGDAGVIFPEGDAAALAAALRRLAGDTGEWQEFARRGRARALAHYTQAALARDYHAIYVAMFAGKEHP
jgi:glycosyltransferase involved in cell wall biosynthesis